MPNKKLLLKNPVIKALKYSDNYLLKEEGKMDIEQWLTVSDILIKESKFPETRLYHSSYLILRF